MKMNPWIWLGIGAVTLTVRADMITFNSGFANGTAIPDGNLSGWSDTRTLSGYSGLITDLNVSLYLSGGYNGQLYGYLTHDTGFAVLLNRVGRSSGNPPGYGDAGFNMTFDDAAADNVHYYQNVSYTLSGGQLLGFWQPDGRNILPTSSAATFNSTLPSTYLSSFNSLDPNGNWTLFLADTVSGQPAAIQSWELDFQLAAVPEAKQWAACLVVAVLGTGYYCRTRWLVKKQPADASTGGGK